MVKLTRLKQLPPDKTYVFDSPFAPKDTLVRTGTIPEGICCVHALLKAFSRDYGIMDRSARVQYVKRLCTAMFGGIDKDDWEDKAGLVAKPPFRRNVSRIFDGLYTMFEENNKNCKGDEMTIFKQLIQDDNDIELYRVIRELVPIEELLTRILPGSFESTEEDLIIECRRQIHRDISSYLKSREEMQEIDREIGECVIEGTRELVDAVIEEAEERAFQSYLADIRKNTQEVDAFSIGVISDRLNRDIYVVQGKDRLLCQQLMNPSNLKRRKSLVIVSIDDQHYETVGRMLPGNRLIRDFSPDDDLIEKFHCFICTPSQLTRRFPDLEEYAPEAFRAEVSPSPSPSASTSSNSECGSTASSSRSNSPAIDYEENDENEENEEKDENDEKDERYRREEMYERYVMRRRDDERRQEQKDDEMRRDDERRQKWKDDERRQEWKNDERMSDGKKERNRASGKFNEYGGREINETKVFMKN